MRSIDAAASLAVLLAFACTGPQAGQQGAPADTMGGDTMAASTVDTGAIADSIRALDRQWSDAAGRRDAQAFAGFYAQDGVLMPPNMEAASGPDAIQQTASQLLADSTTTLSFAPSDVRVADSRDMAWEHGTWQVKDASGNDLDHGKFVVVWKRGEDGSWKVAADIFNSNQPPRKGG